MYMYMSMYMYMYLYLYIYIYCMCKHRAWKSWALKHWNPVWDDRIHGVIIPSYRDRRFRRIAGRLLGLMQAKECLEGHEGACL